jgi:asparagine synthase (glutamine-hydrolysing)
MCGFGGILNNSFPVRRGQLAEVAAAVQFRGPDDCGIRLYDRHLQISEEGYNALFFNRLAIIDLDPRSNQPFEDERYTLMFNGEIYNYRELKKMLQQEGVFFHTTSDTEVLFQILMKWGAKGLNRLNGMFAFCWIDKQEKKFIIARDRMGIKPLYLKQQGQSFIFASELDSVLRLSNGQSTIHPESVRQFLWMQFIPTPNTIVQGIFKLPPGHYIEGNWELLDRRQPLKAETYWDAYAKSATGSSGSAPEQLENILVDSLSRQMIADVPLGLFLSSGVDSSLLAALVNKHFAGSRPFNFFTVAFNETTASDESADALSFIKGFDNPLLQSHTLSIDSVHIGEKLERMYDYFDEPFGDSASLLNWVISTKARQSATVVLSGDGADELFWGYNRYDQWKHPSLRMFNRLNIPGNIAALARPFLYGKYWRTKLALELEQDPLRRHFALFLTPALKHLLKQPIWNDNIWALEHADLVRDRKDLTAILDIKTYLADAMLHKVDRASMAASLEVRVPYLDNTVIDYALELPIEYKSNQHFRHKAILKQLLQQLAPHYSIDRPKKGFSFPLNKWLRFAWKDLVLASVNKESVASLGLDDKIYLPMVEKYYGGDKKFTVAVWYLLNLALWNQKFKNISVLRSI